MMLSQGALFKLHFAFFTLFTAARIRDKGAEPTMDEVWVLDQVFGNEKLRELFTPETYHIMTLIKNGKRALTIHTSLNTGRHCLDSSTPIATRQQDATSLEI